MAGWNMFDRGYVGRVRVILNGIQTFVTRLVTDPRRLPYEERLVWLRVHSWAIFDVLPNLCYMTDPSPLKFVDHFFMLLASLFYHAC